MGRRALRKIDPNLDLSRHLKTPEELPPTWSPAALFGRDAPLQVEVGSGKGMFLATAAAGEPGHNFLGYEISHKYARFAAAKLARAGLTNACLVAGDAMAAFRAMPDECLAAVHVYFPDPWWKKRHHKRRVMNAAFVADIERTLASRGRFHFWTDVEEYFQASLVLLDASQRLAGPMEVAERPADHPLDYQTHFERRMRMHRKDVFRAEFVKE